MLFIALKKLFSRPGLTLLSVAGMTIVMALVVSIPIFSQAINFVMFQEELAEGAAKTRFPAFSLRLRVSPSARYKLSLAQSRALVEHIQETIVSEMGLPVARTQYYVETMGAVLRTRDEETIYGGPHTFLSSSKLAVLPGVAPYLTILDGMPLEVGDAGLGGSVDEDELAVWMHRRPAEELGVEVGEAFEFYDVPRRVLIPVRVVGIWEASDPTDPYWEMAAVEGFYHALLVRPADYQAIAEPLLGEQPGFAYWYLVIDGSGIVPEDVGVYHQGLRRAVDVIGDYLPRYQLDSVLVRALDRAVAREDRLTVLLFVFSVPVLGFLLYFLALISTISLQWQRREIAVMASRGLQRGQALLVSIIEASLLMGLSLPIGIWGGSLLARAMGYVKGFLAFTWREPLSVSPTAYNLPLLVAAVSAVFLARLWPTLRSTRSSVVVHERRRARKPRRPLWQRFYLDVALLVPVGYAYRRLLSVGTLVPSGETGQGGGVQDPLLFLVPVLFAFALSLLMVRLFPLWMRIGDWLFALGRRATPYLAWRHLSRQSNQYASALLLVISALSLGAFLASLGASLDRWLIDRVYYAVGADVLMVQMANPDPEAVNSPVEGAWVLPAQSYLEVPGVLDAARVGLYPTKLLLAGNRTLNGTFIGVDRLDAARVLFYRPDFSGESLGELLNRLAQREDGILVSNRLLAQGGYEIGDKLRLDVDVADVSLTTDFRIVGGYDYFPTVYEAGEEGQTAVIGNLEFLFQSIGTTLLHDIWLRTEADADRGEMDRVVSLMGVYVERWIDAREEIAKGEIQGERLGMFGTLTMGFLAAAVLSGIGLLIYNYASLQERLFRFTILRAVGVSLFQVIGQVVIEYAVLMVYGVASGAAIGVWTSRLFIPFFQATDENVLRPPTLIPMIGWRDIGWISVVFSLALMVAQFVVLRAALRRGVFEALRMGDRE